MIKMLVLIIVLIITLIVFIPFKVQIIVCNSRVDVNLLLFGLLNIRVDVDDFVRKYLKDSNNKINYSKLKIFIKTNYTIRKIIFSILQKTIVDIIEYRIYSDMEQPSKIVLSNYLYLNIIYFFETKVKSIKEKKFNLVVSEHEDFNINLIFRTYVFIIIYYLIKNNKLVIKSKKYLKEVKKSESSN